MFLESGLVHYEEKGTVKNSYLLLPSVTRQTTGITGKILTSSGRVVYD